MSERALARAEQNAALVRVDAGSIDLQKLCEMLGRSGYFKDTREFSQVLVKVLYGQELGIAPVTAMMGIHIIEGKPAPSANLLASIVKRSGVYDYRVKAHTAERADILFLQRGEELGHSVWTIEDAQRAGLTGKGPWKSYPRQMLFARALSEGVRVYCPDLFGGAPVYVPEELGADVNADGEPIRNGGPANRESGAVIDVTGQVRQRGNGDTGEVPYANHRPEQPMTPAETAADDAHRAAAIAASTSAAIKSLGWKDKPYRLFADVLGREIPSVSALTPDERSEIAEGLQRAVKVRAAAMAAYGEFCRFAGIEKTDREQRLAVFAELVGLPHLESSGSLLPSEWRALLEKLNVQCDRLRTEQQPAAALADGLTASEVVSSDPFAGE